MIERWTIWQTEGPDEVVLQVTLTLLDAALWEPYREITKPVGPDRSVAAVKAAVRQEMDEWIAIYGLQLSCW